MSAPASSASLPTRALINRMGFNNAGVAVAALDRIRHWRGRTGSRLVVGGNIGKNKDTPNEEAWKDYELCFKELHDCVDYFVVNVSSPNTPGLRALQGREALTATGKGSASEPGVEARRVRCC